MGYLARVDRLVRCPVEIELIRSIHRIQEILPLWTNLAPASDSKDIFLYPDWLMPWLDMLEKPQNMFWLAAWDNMELVGLFPLRKKSVGGFCFVTLAGLPHADRLDALIQSGFEPECYRAIAQWFCMRPDWDMIFLRAFSPLSATAHNLHNEFRNSGLSTHLIPDAVYPYIQMSQYAGFDDYLIRTRSNFKRKEIRRLGKRLLEQTRGGWVNYDRVEPSLVFDIQHLNLYQSDRGELGESYFTQHDNTRFLLKIAQSLNTKGIIRLFGFQIRQKLCSYLLCFDDHQRLYPYLTSFNRNYAKYSIGMLTLMQAIHFCFDSGYAEFDFLEGGEKYKFQFTHQIRQGWRLMAANNRFKSQIAYTMLAHGVQWYKSVQYQFPAIANCTGWLSRAYRKIII